MFSPLASSKRERTPDAKDSVKAESQPIKRPRTITSPHQCNPSSSNPPSLTGHFKEAKEAQGANELSGQDESLHPSESADHLFSELDATDDGVLVEHPSPSPAPQNWPEENLSLPLHDQNAEEQRSDQASDSTLEEQCTPSTPKSTSDPTVTNAAAPTPTKPFDSVLQGERADTPEEDDQQAFLTWPEYFNTSQSEEKEGSEEDLEGEIERPSDWSLLAMPDNPQMAFTRLERNFIYSDDEKARATGAKLIEKATKIMTQRRLSDWKGPMAENVKQIIDQASGCNETTFMIKLTGALVATKRSVAACESLGDEASEMEKDRVRESILEEWSQAFLFDEYNADFVTNAIPEVTIRNPGDWQELAKSFPRVTKPRPDVQWSIATGAFDDRIVETFRQLNCGLTNSGKSFFSFALLELKGQNEPFPAAVCQCMGGGVGAVYNNRRYKDAIMSSPPSASAPTISPLPGPSPPDFVTGQATIGTPDADTFVYTIAADTTQAHTYVNWALDASDGTVRWHQHFLDSYSFKKPDDIARLHQHLDNILDWGVTVRKKFVEDLALAALREKRYPGHGYVDPRASKKRKLDG